MRDWPDAKRFIFEDLIVYSSSLFAAVFWDYGVNLLAASGIDLFPQEPGLHAISLGKVQLTVLIFSGVQLFRKLGDWQYWR